MTKIKQQISNFINRWIPWINKENYKNAFIRNSIKRRQKFLKHNLYINNVESKVRVIWLKNQQMINDHLIMLKELDYYTCYFLNKQIEFDSFEFKISFDIVIVDFSWKVKYLYPNFTPNQQLNKFDKYHHIFVFSANSIIALNIKLDDIVCPNYK